MDWLQDKSTNDIILLILVLALTISGLLGGVTFILIRLFNNIRKNKISFKAGKGGLEVDSNSNPQKISLKKIDPRDVIIFNNKSMKLYMTTNHIKIKEIRKEQMGFVEKQLIKIRDIVKHDYLAYKKELLMQKDNISELVAKTKLMNIESDLFKESTKNALTEIKGYIRATLEENNLDKKSVEPLQGGTTSEFENYINTQMDTIESMFVDYIDIACIRLEHPSTIQIYDRFLKKVKEQFRFIVGECYRNAREIVIKRYLEIEELEKTLEEEINKFYNQEEE